MESNEQLTCHIHSDAHDNITRKMVYHSNQVTIELSNQVTK